jgi:hypothetical protein
MQNVQAEEISSQEKKVGQFPQISRGSRIGSVMLLGALAILLFKCAPFYWPLTLAAFLGDAAIRLWKKKGLLLSLTGLCFGSILILRSGHEPLWTVALAVSIAISWLLIFLGKQEADAFFCNRETATFVLEAERLRLEKELKAARSSNSEEQHKAAEEGERLRAFYCEEQRKSTEEKEHLRALYSEEQRKSAEERERLNALYLESALTLAQAKQLLKASEQEREAMADQCQTQIHHQYALLREQFQEKSEALDQSRKELFRVENDFLALEKAWEEKKCEPSEIDFAIFRDLKSLEEECHEWENQVVILQEFISSLLLPKKRPRSKKNKNAQGLLPDLIQNKIDQRIGELF